MSIYTDLLVCLFIYLSVYLLFPLLPSSLIPGHPHGVCITHLLLSMHSTPVPSTPSSSTVEHAVLPHASLGSGVLPSVGRRQNPAAKASSPSLILMWRFLGERRSGSLCVTPALDPCQVVWRVRLPVSPPCMLRQVSWLVLYYLPFCFFHVKKTSNGYKVYEGEKGKSSLNATSKKNRASLFSEGS